MNAVRGLQFAGLLVLAGLVGCKGSQETTPAAKQYPIKGEIVAVDTAKPSVKLDHEEIPGLMQAMEMDYAVEDAKLLDDLKAGDQVEGQLKVESGEYIITELKKR